MAEEVSVVPDRIGCRVVVDYRVAGCRIAGHMESVGSLADMEVVVAGSMEDTDFGMLKSQGRVGKVGYTPLGKVEERQEKRR